MGRRLCRVRVSGAAPARSWNARGAREPSRRGVAVLFATPDTPAVGAMVLLLAPAMTLMLWGGLRARAQRWQASCAHIAAIAAGGGAVAAADDAHA